MTDPLTRSTGPEAGASSAGGPAGDVPAAEVGGSARGGAPGARRARGGKRRNPERERELELLWAAYREDPCDRNRNALVEAYRPLAREIARHFAMKLPRSVDRGDLTTAADVGLMAAVAGFDPERGVRFESYCELRVKGALLDELRTQDWLPRPWRQKLEHQKRAIEDLRTRNGRDPADDEVAEELDMSLEEYLATFGTALPGVSTGRMGAEEGRDGAPATLDVVPDTSQDAPADVLTREEILRLAAQRLSDQEYRILYLRYWEGLAMREIGELTGLSESRVCKVHARLIERLRDRFRVAHGDD